VDLGRAVHAAVDPNSTAYHEGEMAGPLILAVIALIVLWIATRKFRHPVPVLIPEDLEATAELARTRTRQVGLWSAGIVVLAIGLAVVQALQRGDFQPSAASQGRTDLSITAPSDLGDYRLMSAAQLAQYPDARPAADGADTVYYATSGGQPVLKVVTAAAADNPDLARDLGEMPAGKVNQAQLDSAQVEHAQTLDSGPAGGVMQCGKNTTNAVCSWTDSSTTGFLVAALDGFTMDQLADLTREFRSAAER
jgi:hypothetical protein